MRVGWLVVAIVLLNCPVHAGGPEFVAGPSFFDPTIKGVPCDLAAGRHQLLHRSR